MIDNLYTVNARPEHRGRGFTLVEMLVVIGIISILSAIIIPAIQGATDDANRARCLANMHGLGLAMHSYAEDHRSYFPFDQDLTELDPSDDPELESPEAALSKLFQRGYLDDPRVLICPGSLNFADKKEGDWEDFELTSKGNSYAMRRWLTSRRQDSTTPILADKRSGPRGHHRDRLVILTVGGSAETVSLDDDERLEELIDQFSPTIAIDEDH